MGFGKRTDSHAGFHVKCDAWFSGIEGMLQSRTCFQAVTNQFNKFRRMEFYPSGWVTRASRIQRRTGLQVRLQNNPSQGGRQF